MIKMKEVKVSKKVTEEVMNSEASKTQKILSLFANGLDVKEIAGKMGIRYNFAYNVVSNAILKGEITEDQIERTKKSGKKDEILRLAALGKSNKDIAAELKCTYNQVWTTLKGNQ